MSRTCEKSEKKITNLRKVTESQKKLEKERK